MGVLVIEVKSHDVIETNGNGQWRFNRKEWVNRSPFDQADGAMRSIEDHLERRGITLIGFPIWYAVWLTSVDAARVPPSIGWHGWQLLDRGDLLTPDIRQPILRALRKAGEHLAAARPGWRLVAGALPPAKVDAMLEVLEPRFTVEASAAELGRRRRLELERFTEEQHERAETIAETEAVLVEGPPGSGKTVLAVEAACRAAAAGERVLFVVFNRLIERQLAQQAEGVQVRRIHGLMADVAGIRFPPDADDAWFNERLPELATEAALGLDHPPFDRIVIDEAQDLARSSYLDFLDLMLVGGWRHGRSVVVGDFDNQYIYRDASHQGADGAVAARAEFLDRMHRPARMRLTVNTRATPEVVALCEQATGRTGIYRTVRRAPSREASAAIWHWNDSATQLDLLIRALDEVLSGPFSSKELVVLSPYRSSAARALREAKREPRLSTGLEDAHGVRWGTIHQFKGLESPAVIVTDIDLVKPRILDLLFVGATRATDRLIVLQHGDAPG